MAFQAEGAVRKPQARPMSLAQPTAVAKPAPVKPMVNPTAVGARPISGITSVGAAGGGVLGGARPVNGITQVGTSMIRPMTQPTSPGTAGGWQDLRSQIFSPSQSSGTQYAAGAVNTLADRLVNYQFPGFRSVAPANYGAARGYLGDAAQATRGMKIGQYGDIPINSFSQSYGLLGQARGAIPGQDAIRDFQTVQAGGPFNPAEDTEQARNIVMRQLLGLQGPDRGALAESTFNRLVESTNPQWQQDLRTVGQKNAALGRLGSGMVTNQLMDVTAQREKELAMARAQLADDAAARTLDDRLGILGAGQSVFGQFGAEDRNNEGLNLDLRNEQRNERDAGIGYDFNKANLGLARSGALSGLAGQYAGLDTERRNERVGERDFDFNRDLSAAQLAGSRAGILAGLGGTEAGIATNQYNQRANERDSRLNYGLNRFGAQAGLLGQMAGLENQRFNQDLTGRNEMRSERDYQTGLAQQTIDNRVRQAQLQEDLLNGANSRWLDQINTMGGLGYSGNPASTLMYGAGQYGQQAGASMEGLGDMMSQYAILDQMRRNGQI